VERLEGEHDDLREALSWVLERGDSKLGLRFGGALWRFWHVRGYLDEGTRWMERVLAEGEPAASPLRVKALEGMGWMAQLQGDTERAEATYAEMLKLSRELGDKGNIATALNSLGTLALTRGDNERSRALLEENLSVIRQLEEEGNSAAMLKRFHALSLLAFLALNEEGDCARATALLEESVALARGVGDVFRIGQSLSNLGYAVLLQGDIERARALCEETLTIAHELGRAGVEILPEAFVNLGLAELGQGEYERAATALGEGLTTAQEVGIKASVINALEGTAALAGAMGEDTRASRLWGAAEASRETTGIALPPGDRALHEPYLAAARSRLGEAAWEEALAEGRAMSLEEAAQYARTKDEESAAPATPVLERSSAGVPIGELTSREEEVAVLVARGLTNRQVSTELGISERTAGNHVARILRKLGLRSRTQVASWVAERQLLAPDPD
jgi:DNA-binding CsgD family transcriptional regulator/tetratricopeptide (TPR) repeat protein